MAYTNTVTLVSPTPLQGDVSLDATLVVNFEDLLPWAFYVNGELKVSYPQGSVWYQSVNPVQLGIPGGQWQPDTQYSWYVRYAYYADTKTWNGSEWEFTGLLYTNTPTRAFTTRSAGATKPTNPTPANSATEVDFSGFQLSWNDGGSTDTYDVYIGPSGSLTQVSSAQAGTTYTTTLAELESIFGVSPINQKIYWRVDATADGDTATGDEWNFDARPGAASNPTPADEATGITLDELTAEWDAGANADTYDLYFGTLSGLVSLTEEGITGTSGTLQDSPLQSNDIYYWKVRARNDFGYTDTAEYSFTTISFDPPLPSGITLDADGNPTGSADGLNNMITMRRLIAAAENAFWYEDI